MLVEQSQSGSSAGRGGNLSVTSDSDNEESQNNRKKSLNFKQRKSKWVGKATLSFINQVFSRGGIIAISRQKSNIYFFSLQLKRSLSKAFARTRKTHNGSVSEAEDGERERRSVAVGTSCPGSPSTRGHLRSKSASM